MNRLILTAAVAAAAFANSAAAQPAEKRGGWMQADITRREATQLADMMFQRFDLNHDGTLTREEVERARSDADGEGSGRAERMIARLFGDAQSITLAQAEAQALARFDAQDLNHDGVVTAAEREQARAARGQAR